MSIVLAQIFFCVLCLRAQSPQDPWELQVARFRFEARTLHNRKPGISALQKVDLIEDKKAYTVDMDEAALLGADSRNYGALYTHGAGPCSIFVIVGKDANQKVRQVALAHLSASVNEEDILRLIAQFQGLADIRFSIISGSYWSVSPVLEVLRQLGLGDKIDFFDIDEDGNRTDALAVDKEGRLYYGENGRWHKPSRAYDDMATHHNRSNRLSVQIL